MQHPRGINSALLLVRKFAASMLFLMLVTLFCLAGNAGEHHGRQFIGITNFSNFSRSQTAGGMVMTSPRLSPEVDWNELIVSWNTGQSPESLLTIDVRGIFPDHSTKFYTLGRWASDGKNPLRGSVKDQLDADGEVLTDTLLLARPGAEVEVRLTFSGSKDGGIPRVKFIGISFANTKSEPLALPPNKTAWGRLIDVPQRSQLSYPDGKAWCSPTGVSMVLSHWGNVLHRSELNSSVPSTAKAVFDPNWPGTGNWPFNTAFAGSQPGMRGYVTRLGGVSEIEDWIAGGIPVVLSISYSALKGIPKERTDGHIVVCVGFDASGNPIINDPGSLFEMRKTFPRENLIKAWATSHNTAYLIHPESKPVPKDPHGHWFQR